MVERSLYAETAKGRTSASCKNVFLKIYGITCRQFNGCRVSLEGKISACKAGIGQAIASLKQQLDSLARVRLALGRKLYQVDQYLIVGAHTPVLSEKVQLALRELDFKVMQLSAQDIDKYSVLSTTEQIFLADPHNYLILRYASSAQAEDIYKDLKLLLTNDKNG